MPEKAKTIEIYVKADGTVIHVVNGAVGSECDALTKPLEDALGGSVLERTNKETYYEGDGSSGQTISVSY